MRDLGTLPGDLDSFAYGINDAGQVVGYSFMGEQGPERAYLWSAGVMTDLNDLIPPDSGWVLDEAYAINDAGQIVGGGTFNGEGRAFRLTPIETRAKGT